MNDYTMRFLMGSILAGLVLGSFPVFAQTDETTAVTATDNDIAAEETTAADSDAASSGKSELELKAAIAVAEAEKAKAEAEKVKAEAALAQATADAKMAEVKAAESSQQNAQSETDTSATSEEESQPNHRGFYLRFTPGLGLGTVWANGTMDPLPGIERIDDPSHTSITGMVGADLGAGIVKNLALHVGAFFEKIILRDKEPTRMAFSIFGIGAGLTWYFTDLELYLTGQFRWVSMLIKYPEVSCSEYFEDSFDWYKGPGLSVTFGREWFENAKDQGAAGIGIQANYYRVHGGIEDHFAFNHFSLLLVLTFTRF